MGDADFASMHRDHKQWLSDNDMWRCDVASWQEELRRAETQLKEIESSLKDHGRTLQAHAASIRIREQDLRAHEHAIATRERGETASGSPAVQPAHDRETANHAQLFEAHERLKQLHHRVIAQISELRSAVGKAG